MNKTTCQSAGLAIRDTLDVVGSKWTQSIMHTLIIECPQRFKELQRNVDGITARMLSKELKALEINQMVDRRVYDTSPITVEYTITQHGRSLKPVIEALYTWGMHHRRRIFEIEEA
jgi:DNA-binding HxlR family transcriptional regulator